MALQTRKPTGAVPWPLILVEGGEKCGKTFSCAVLSASGRVGRSAWLDLGEGSGDEYGAVSGARYEVIEHDGSWPSIIGQVAGAKAEAQADRDAGKKPFLLVIDTGTAEWDLLKGWADARARLMGFNKDKLKRDPNGEVTIPMNLWNDANARHRKLMTMLMTFPGIVIVTARGKEVAAMDDKGRPVEGTKEYKVEGHKNLAYDASCWVRMFRDKPAVVVGARSVHAGIRPGKDDPKRLDPDWTLEWLIFDYLKCDPSAAHVRDMPELRPDPPEGWTLDGALTGAAKAATLEECREMWRVTATAAKAQACTAGEAKTVQELIAARMETLKADAALAALGEDNGWLTNLRDVSSADEVERVAGEFDEAFKPVADEDPRKVAIGSLIVARTREFARHRAPELAAAS